MRHEIVHMIGEQKGIITEELPLGNVATLRTRCGRTIESPLVSGVPTRYEMIAMNGNVFQCTTRARFASCRKCINLIGATSAKAIARPVIS